MEEFIMNIDSNLFNQILLFLLKAVGFIILTGAVIIAVVFIVFAIIYEFYLCRDVIRDMRYGTKKVADKLKGKETKGKTRLVE